MSDFTIEDILTPEEAAKFLKMEVKRLLRLAKRGEVPAKRMGREWRFKASELSRWFANWTPDTFDPNRRAGEILAEINGKKKTGI
jgi:excisionase family DNA binding protein